jgi:acetylcholinesterase
MRLVAVIPLLWAALGVSALPHLQLGDTVLVGRKFQSSNVDFFGGIPFAEPPVADLRLSPPRPKYSLSPLRSFDARSYGLPCLQPVSRTSFPSL